MYIYLFLVFFIIKFSERFKCKSPIDNIRNLNKTKIMKKKCKFKSTKTYTMQFNFPFNNLRLLLLPKGISKNIICIS